MSITCRANPLPLSTQIILIRSCFLQPNEFDPDSYWDWRSEKKMPSTMIFICQPVVLSKWPSP